jgi:predicted MFS family arabinose efflux permease
LVALSFFLWGVGEGLWFYIQPLYPESLGATPSQAGVTLGLMGVGRLAAILPFTLGLTRFPSRMVFLPGYICGPLSMAVAVVAPSWQVAGLAFFLYGITSAALIPISLYIAQAEALDPTRHPETSLHTMLTFIWAANSAGIIIAPPLGGLLGQVVGLRAVFALSGLWFGLSLLVVWGVPSYPSPAPPPRQQAQGLAGNRAFWALVVVFALLFVAAPLAKAFYPTYLGEVQGYSTALLGVMGMMSAVGITLSSLGLGRMAAWTAFWLGQGLIIIGLVVLALWHEPPLVALGYALTGSWYAMRPVTTSLISQVVQEHQRGAAFATIELLVAGGTLLAPFIAGRLYERGPLLPLMWGLGAALLTLGLSLLYGWCNAPALSAYTQQGFIMKGMEDEPVQ